MPRYARCVQCDQVHHTNERCEPDVLERRYDDAELDAMDRGQDPEEPPHWEP